VKPLALTVQSFNQVSPTLHVRFPAALHQFASEPQERMVGAGSLLITKLERTMLTPLANAPLNIFSAADGLYSHIIAYLMHWHLLGMAAWILSCVLVMRTQFFSKSSRLLASLQAPKLPGSPQSPAAVASSVTKAAASEDTSKTDQISATPKVMLPFAALHRTVSPTAIAAVPLCASATPCLNLPFLKYSSEDPERKATCSTRATSVSFDDVPEWLYYDDDLPARTPMVESLPVDRPEADTERFAQVTEVGAPTPKGAAREAVSFETSDDEESFDGASSDEESEEELMANDEESPLIEPERSVIGGHAALPLGAFTPKNASATHLEEEEE
jgi:hypothetical protein